MFRMSLFRYGCPLLPLDFLEFPQKKRGGFVKKLSVFLLLAIFSTISRPANAQTVTAGTVIGAITDPSGAAVADAAVVLRNKGTNNQATQKTNSAGQYTFVNV